MTRLDGEAGTPSVTDHDFAPPEGRPWDRCAVCGYSQAAHERVPVPYVPPGLLPVRFHAAGCPWPNERCTCRERTQ